MVEDHARHASRPETPGFRPGSGSFEEFEKEVSPEAKVVRDADLLECIVQAREYQTLGYNDVADWIFNAQAALKTESAKKIAEECLKTEPKEWWQGLKAK